MQAAPPQSANFGFLQQYDAALVMVAARAEQYFPDDPVTALMKLRQFGELLAQQLAARTGVYGTVEEPQAELLTRLRREGTAPREIVDLFHDLRRVGNTAIHGNQGDHAAAMAALKLARQLAIFFHRTFGDRAFKPGPFQPPRAPADATTDLRAEIDRLRAERDAGVTAVERASEAAKEALAAREAAEARATSEAADRAVWETLAAEEQAARTAMAAELAALQQAAAAAPTSVRAAIEVAAFAAAEALDLDEASTRDRINAQLRARGWGADSRVIRHAAGIRPMKGRAMAIAEWPTVGGPADYALFVGPTCVGVVEAKRRNKNVAAAIGQAGRYAQDFLPELGIETPPGGPWPADTLGQEPAYRLPFLFSANGRG